MSCVLGVWRKVSCPEVLRPFFCERRMRCGFFWCISYSSQWTGQAPGYCFLDMDFDVPVLATSWGCRAHHGYDELFRAVCTGTRPWLTPAIRAGKGWRGRRELAPRCLPPNELHVGTTLDRHGVFSMISTTHTHTTRRLSQAVLPRMCDLFSRMDSSGRPPVQAAETSLVVETRANVSCCGLGSCVTPQCAAVRRPKGPDDRHQCQREGEVREQYHGLRAQERPLPGMRPAPLLEVLPQVGVQRHTVEQRIEHTPYVQILDAPVPLMVEQLVDVLQLLDALIPVAEQVIDVPKMFIERIPPRTSVREPQLAEQLVEVPTIVSFSSLQRIMEQTVDIAVPQGGGRLAGPQGFLPGQSSTALHGSQERISERIRERLLEQMLACIPDEGPQGFLPGQSSSSSSHRPAGISEDTDEPVDGFFCTFPRGKKV